VGYLDEALDGTSAVRYGTSPLRLDVGISNASASEMTSAGTLSVVTTTDYEDVEDPLAIVSEPSPPDDLHAALI